MATDEIYTDCLSAITPFLFQRSDRRYRARFETGAFGREFSGILQPDRGTAFYEGRVE